MWSWEAEAAVQARVSVYYPLPEAEEEREVLASLKGPVLPPDAGAASPVDGDEGVPDEEDGEDGADDLVPLQKEEQKAASSGGGGGGKSPAAPAAPAGPLGADATTPQPWELPQPPTPQQLAEQALRQEQKK